MKRVSLKPSPSRPWKGLGMSLQSGLHQQTILNKQPHTRLGGGILLLPALSSGWIYKKQYDVLVDMKKTRMRPELKYAQPPAQTLLTFCAVILVRHVRFSYDMH